MRLLRSFASCAMIRVRSVHSVARRLFRGAGEACKLARRNCNGRNLGRRLRSAWSAMQRAARGVATPNGWLQDKTAVLNITLDHMDQGLMMFDEHGTVQICNRRAI